VLYIIKESIFEIRDKTVPKEGLYVIICVVVYRCPVAIQLVDFVDGVAFHHKGVNC
jgi:hypothetical protein